MDLQIKKGINGFEPMKFKARLVAKGYTQNEGIYFKEVFSPVVRHASIRVILAITAVQDMELDQLDVKTAFLHGRLEEEILMSQPEGYEFPGKEDNTIKDGLYIYLLLYIDDMLVACKDREEIDKLKVLLNSEFEMKDLGYAKKILGMEIRRNRSKGIMFLSQEKYLRKVLETFDMSKAKPLQLPLASHFRLSNLQCPQTEAQKQGMASVPYANAVGCLMYVMVLTRPDIAHVVSVVSRYMAQPGEDHWKAVKWILRRRSLTGYLFMLNGCAVNWKATLQSVVALSTTEAEYTAATEAVKEALWLKGNEVSRGAVKMVKIHTDENLADAFTKVIPVAKFRAYLDLAGLCSQ
ncbi:CCHC-type domain-containing protein [Citrus sinensis]|uniref:CCHC-type domain-containing protein n=1 Tax=Citrus sinensis TaxID=2711 RepID=A0ACB8N1T0_CITSI|nr:CCHC-type domain-containing protein [Citrus sinensis]